MTQEEIKKMRALPLEQRGSVAAYNKGGSYTFQGGVLCGYKIGAKEQVELDIDVACKFTCSQCPLRCVDVLTIGYVACTKYADRNECPTLQTLKKEMKLIE